MSTKYVLLYEPAEDVLAKAPLHFAAHSARGQEFHERGSLLAYGPFGDPQAEGPMAVFTSREAAEEFARQDPFVLNGVVRGWQIREWKRSLSAVSRDDTKASIRSGTAATRSSRRRG